MNIEELEDVPLNTPEEINAFFITCCECNDVTSLESLMANSHLKVSLEEDTLRSGFDTVVERGYVELIQRVFEEPGCEWYHFCQESIEQSIFFAISNKKIEAIQYLLEHPQMPETEALNAMLASAVSGDFFELIEYFAIQYNMKEMYSMPNNPFFYWACKEGCYNVALGLLQKHTQYLEFQKSQYNVEWACKTARTPFVLAMMQHLLQFDPIEFYANESMVKDYLQSKNMDISILNEFKEPIPLKTEEVPLIL